MFGIRTRTMMAALVASLTSPVALMAQWGSDCSCYSPQQYVTAPAPVVTTACQCLQPVTQMVSREMQVTEYVPRVAEEKRPVQRVRYVAKKATAYRQVMETKVVEVPAMQYQTVTEYQTRVIPKTQWRTVVQPVPKMAPCQYDNRPGMIGSMNRMGYQMRSAFQPNYLTHRQQVSQVCQCKVPVQRQVAVQTTRKVAYQEAKMVPYDTTQQVAEYYTDYETVKVTTMEPRVVTKTVQVPETRFAAIDPFTGMAIAPAPATRSADAGREPTRAAEGDAAPVNGPHKGISYPKPAAQPTLNDHNVIQKASPAAAQKVAKVTRRATGTVSESDDWTAHTPAASEPVATKPLKSKTTVASTKP